MSAGKGKNKLLGNIASLGIVQIANYVFPLISIPIISRIIGPDKYGVINYAASFMAYFTILVNYGFDLTATRRVAAAPANQELVDRVFSEVLKAKILLFVISICIFIPCIFFVGPLRQEKTVAIFSFLVVFSFVITENWLFQAKENLKKVAIFNFIGKLIFTVLILIIIRKKQDYIWQPLLLGISQILVSIISYVWAVKLYSVKLVSVSFKRILQLLKEEKTVFLSMVVISLYTTTNTVILGLLRSPTEVGYYTASGKLMDVASSVINIPLAQAFFPFIGKAFAENLSKGKDIIKRITPIVFYITLLAGLGMFLFGPIVLKLFYGKAFTPSIPVFQITSFVPMIISLSNIFGIQVMLNLKMDKAFFRITAIGAIVGIILNLFMTHFLGYIGTAWNWLIVEIFITLVMYAHIKKEGINPFELRYFNPKNIITYFKNRN